MDDNDFYQPLHDNDRNRNHNATINELDHVSQAFQFMPSLKPMLERYLTNRKVRITEQDIILAKVAEHIDLLPQIGWEVPVHYRVSIFDCLQELLKNQTNSIAKPYFQNSVVVTSPMHPCGSKYFSLLWRNQILQNSWTEMLELQNETGRLYYTVLHRRHQKHSLTSDNLLADLLDQFTEVPSKRAFRVFLLRAQMRFAKFIVEQVARTIYMANRSLIQNELHELGLNCYWDQMVQDLAYNKKYKAMLQPVDT